MEGWTKGRKDTRQQREEHTDIVSLSPLWPLLLRLCRVYEPKKDLCLCRKKERVLTEENIETLFHAIILSKIHTRLYTIALEGK